MAERGSEIWDSGRAGAGWPDYPSHANTPPPPPPMSPVGSQSNMGGGGGWWWWWWGLGAGHSCFPFLLNHTAAIWTRLRLHSAAELLCRPQPQPGPQSPGPCLLLQCLILAVPALCSSEDHCGSSGPAHAAHVDKLLCVCVCACVRVFVCPTSGPLMSNFNTTVSLQQPCALFGLHPW